MLPSKIAHKQKKKTNGLSFFLRHRRRYIVDGVDVMAELEDFSMKVYETKKNKGLWKKMREPKKNKRQLKRPSEEREATGELTNYKRTFK